jgi:hypothetical protein
MNPVERQLALLNRETVFSFAVTVHLAQRLDPEILRRAVPEVQRRHHNLNLLLRYEPEPWLDWDPARAVRLERSEHAGEPPWSSAVETLLNQRCDGPQDPFLRLHLLSHPGGAVLVACFNHVLADAMSGSGVVRDLLVACDALLAGRQPALVPLPELAPSLELVRRSARGPWRRLRAARALAHAAWDEACNLPQRRRADPLPRRQRDIRLRQVRLDPAATSRIVAACRDQGTTVQGMLCALMMRALAGLMAGGHPGRGRVTIDCGSVHDLRPMLQPPVSEEQLGLWVGQVFHRHGVKPSADPWHLARAGRDRLTQALEHQETLHLYALLLSRDFTEAETLLGFFEKRHPWVEVSNIGRWDYSAELSQIEVTGMHFASSVAYVAACRQFLGVYATTWCGALTLNFEWCAQAWPEARVAAVVDEVERWLQRQ